MPYDDNSVLLKYFFYLFKFSSFNFSYCGAFNAMRSKEKLRWPGPAPQSTTNFHQIHFVLNLIERVGLLFAALRLHFVNSQTISFVCSLPPSAAPSPLNRRAKPGCSWLSSSLSLLSIWFHWFHQFSIKWRREENCWLFNWLVWLVFSFRRSHWAVSAP